MDGEIPGGERWIGLPHRPLPARRWRWARRYRVGPLRTVAEAVTPSVLGGMRSGAILGLAIAGVLSLPVLLVLSARTPDPSPFEPPPRAWAAVPGVEAPHRARVEPADEPVPVVTALAVTSPAPTGPSAPGGEAREQPAFRVDLLPVLDTVSLALPVADPSAPAAKPARTARVPVASRAPKAP